MFIFCDRHSSFDYLVFPGRLGTAGKLASSVNSMEAKQVRELRLFFFYLVCLKLCAAKSFKMPMSVRHPCLQSKHTSSSVDGPQQN